MADTNKLSVEKALEKIRHDDQVKSREQQRNETAEALSEEIRRMRAQRLRLEKTTRKRS